MEPAVKVSFYRDVHCRVFARVTGHPADPRPQTYVLQPNGTWKPWSSRSVKCISFIQAAWEKHLNKLIVE